MSVLSYIKKFREDDLDEKLIRGYKLLNSDRPYMVIVHEYQLNDNSFLDNDIDILMMGDELNIIYMKYMEKIVISDDYIGSYENDMDDTDYITEKLVKHIPLYRDFKNSKIYDRRYMSGTDSCYIHLHGDEVNLYIVNENGAKSIPHYAPKATIFLLYKSSALAVWNENCRLFIKIYEDNITFDVKWPYLTPKWAVIYDNCLYVYDDNMLVVMAINLTTRQNLVLKIINYVEDYHYFHFCSDDGKVYLISEHNVHSFKLPSWKICLSIGEYMEEDKPADIELQCSDGFVIINKYDIESILYLTDQQNYNNHSGQNGPLSVSFDCETMTNILILLHHQSAYDIEKSLQLLSVAKYLQCHFVQQIIYSNLLLEGYNSSCLKYIEDLLNLDDDIIEDVATKWLVFHRRDMSNEKIKELTQLNEKVFYKVFRGDVNYDIKIIEINNEWLLTKYE